MNKIQIAILEALKRRRANGASKESLCNWLDHMKTIHKADYMQSWLLLVKLGQ